MAVGGHLDDAVIELVRDKHVTGGVEAVFRRTRWSWLAGLGRAAATAHKQCHHKTQSDQERASDVGHTCVFLSRQHAFRFSCVRAARYLFLMKRKTGGAKASFVLLKVYIRGKTGLH